MKIIQKKEKKVEKRVGGKGKSRTFALAKRRGRAVGRSEVVLRSSLRE